MSSVLRRVCLGALPLMLSLAAPVAAQAEDSAPAKKTAPVKDEDVSGFDTINVTATKTESKAIDVLGGATTVTRKDIERTQPTTIGGLLTAVPGVWSQSTPNDPGQSISVRGLQDFGRVNVLVDGARQDFQMSGHNANGTFYLDPEFLAGADVVRGPIANIYGSGAIGGVVSLRTNGVDDILAPDEKYGAVQKFGVGTNGAGILESTSAGARLGTYLDVFSQFVWRNTATYRDGSGAVVPDTGSSAIGGIFKLNLRPNDFQEISLSALGQENEFINNGTSKAGTRFASKVDTGTYTLGYHFANPDLPLIDLHAKVYYTETKDTQTVIKPTSTYSALGVVPGNRLSDHVGTTGLDLYNTARFATGSLDHVLTLGGDAAWDRVTTVDQAGGYVSALTPSGNRTLSGAFLQDEVRYGGWLRVLGGLRYDAYDLSGGGRTSSGSRLSPKITVGVTPIKGFEIYGTYAEGYRAPAITETLISGKHPFPAFSILANPALRPEVGRTLEAGVNLQYDGVLTTGDSFRAKFDVFDNNVDNYIDMVPTGPSYLVPFIPGMPTSVCGVRPTLCFPITSYQYQNIARAELRGAELEATYDWRQGFASVAAMITNGRNKATGAALNTVAPGRVSGTLGFRFLDEKLTVGGRYTYVDRSAPTVSAPSKAYTLGDLFASYAYDDRININASVSNVFDRRYVQYLSSDPSAGVTAKLAVSVKFAAK